MQNPYEIRFKLQTFSVHDSSSEAGKTYKSGAPVSSSEAAATYSRAIFAGLDADKEHFVMLALNNKNRVIGFKVVSTGSLTASIVHPREVFRAAIFLDAVSIIVVHNHPSGDPAPSREDIDITARLKAGAELLGLRLFDHVVLGDGRFFSFNDRGML